MRKVNPGDPLVIPANAYNAFVDAAEAHKRETRSMRRRGRENSHDDGVTLRVRNDTGADADRFDVLGIDAPIFDPSVDEDAFTRERAFSCVTPADSHGGAFVILQEPIRSGKVGRARAAGVCPVKVDVEDEDHTFAKVKDGESGHLKSAAERSARILWKEAGTGETWALIRFASGVSGNYDSPHDLTFTGEHGESARSGAYEDDEGDTVLWSRLSPPSSTDGVRITLQTGESYYDAGDQVLYAYYADLLFDSAGRLVKISGERRVATDTPEPCP